MNTNAGRTPGTPAALVKLWSATTPEEFGRALLELRDEHAKLSMRQVSTKCGVGRSTLSGWERGTNGPRDFTILAAVLKVLGVQGPNDLKRCRDSYERLFETDQTATKTEPARDTKILGWLPATASSFQPRPETMQAIQDAWDAQNPLRERVVVLTGAGGCGKTQIALAVVLNPTEQAPYRLWVPAQSAQSLIAGLVRLAPALGCQPSPQTDRVDVALDVLETLSHLEQEWILVLDGLDDPSMMRIERHGEVIPLWPRGLGRVLITTRHRGVWTHSAGRKRVLVGSFTSDESLSYLDRTLTDNGMTLDGQTAAMRDLCERLGHYPLALAQAAAFMAVQAQDCAEYAAMLTQHQLTDVMPTDSVADGYDRTISSTWQLSAHLAALASPDVPVKGALEVASVLGPGALGEQLWFSDAVTAYLSSRTAETPTVTPDEARRALRELHAYNLLEHQVDESGQGSVLSHPMTQRAVWESIDAPARVHLANAVASGIVEIWSPSGTSAELTQSLAQASRSLLGLCARSLWEPEPHPLWLHMSALLGASGWMDEAINHLVCTVSVSVSKAGPHHPHTLQARRDLVYWKLRSCDPWDVDAELDDILHSATTRLGEFHELTLQVRTLRAQRRCMNNDGPGALAELQTLAADSKQHLGAEHWATLWTDYALATVHIREGQWEQARDILAQVAAISRDYFGPYHQETLMAQANYGRSLTHTGAFDAAEEVLTAVQKKALETLGDRHLISFVVQSNYGELLMKRGDGAAGQEILNDLHARSVSLLGGDHEITKRIQSMDAHGRHPAFDLN